MNVDEGVWAFGRKDKGMDDPTKDQSDEDQSCLPIDQGCVFP